MTWVESERVVKARASSPIVDVGVGTLDGFTRHQTGRNAAVLTYFGFLSIFPLFMVATSVLGFVLQNNEDLQERILDTAAAQIPGLGQQIEQQSGELQGSVVTVVIGLVITLWAATRAFAGLQNAFDDIWEIPLEERDNLAVRRVKGVVGIAVIGSGLIVTAVLSSLVSSFGLPFGGRILLVLGTAAINGSVLWVMMRYLTAASVSWRAARVGAIIGGIGFTALQVLGTFIMSRFLESARNTAGDVFADVLAIMAWINLHAMISLITAELNAALVRRRLGRDDTQMWLTSEVEGPASEQIG